MSPIRVLLADDHALFREGVAGLLASEPDFEVVGEAPDGAQAVSLARALAPDVVVMDVSMPVMDGLEATRRIREELPAVKVVMLTVSCGVRVQEQARASGAQGCLSKAVPPGVLCNALRAAALQDQPESHD
jgi:DNA-binding NarL/FixJ family response regulator